MHWQQRHGLRGAGNCLISDRCGESLSVEFNGGGVNVLPACEGICTHANHPEGQETAPFEYYPDLAERENSRYRMHGLWQCLHAERGRLSTPRCLQLLADHTHSPLGICRHQIGGDPDKGTTAAVVAEPTAGLLHVVRGNPCVNRPATYSLESAP